MLRELQAGDPHFIEPYRLRGLLGVGGMGRVFLGVSPEGQPVAVKVIRADLATDSEFRARFRREVTVARRVSSHFTAPVVGADASLDRVPAEVRALIERCLAKDPGQRPTAHDVLAATGTVQPTVGWLPEPVTRTFVQLPTRADPPLTVTSLVGPASAEPVPGPPPGRQDPRRRRGLGRPLAIAAVVAGLLAASAAGGYVLTASTHQSSGMHSGQAVSRRTTSPATSVPPTSAAPSTSQTAAAAPSTSAAATPPPGSAPAATPPASMSPPPSPAASPSATPSAASSAPGAPPSSAASWVPGATPTSGGY